jgi:dynein heavy chain
MKWFRELFEKSFTYSETKVKDVRGRVKQLKTDFRKVLYGNVCRSLFEQHKLMFAFSMAVKLNIEGDTGEE